MGGRSSFWGVAVAALMVTIILCSSNSSRASSLGRANATYGEVEVELLVRREIARFLNFNGLKVHTDKTQNPFVKSCGNGQGNPMGDCSGSPTNKKHCNSYAGASAC